MEKMGIIQLLINIGNDSETDVNIISKFHLESNYQNIQYMSFRTIIYSFNSLLQEFSVNEETIVIATTIYIYIYYIYSIYMLYIAYICNTIYKYI